MSLSDLVDFEADNKNLSYLSASQQKRLDVLMAKNNEGELTATEQQELLALVNAAETITLHNARLLAQQQKKLATDSKH